MFIICEKESKITIMVNAQQWLDRNYPNKKTVEKIELNETWTYSSTKIKLEGKLVIDNYPNLKHVMIWEAGLESLRIINCPQLTSLVCSKNKFTSLDLSQCDQLEWLTCENGFLADIKFPNNPDKLYHLYLARNKFSCDLSLFSKLTKLQELRIYENGFYGSLEPLKNLHKLEFLQIDDTDIDSGLEYLTDSVQRFLCDCFPQWCEYPEAKSKILEAQLTPYEGSYLKWRENNQELIKQTRLKGLTREEQLIELNLILAKQLRETQSKLQDKEKELESTKIISQNVIKQSKEENKQLEEKIQEQQSQAQQIQVSPKGSSN